MASQPLAFGELLLGGVLVASAIKNEPLSEFVKHGLSGAATPTAAEGAVPGEGGDTPHSSSESQAIAKGELLAPPTSGSAGDKATNPYRIYEEYLGHELSPKEKKEVGASK
jgi:hypothetical protein